MIHGCRKVVVVQQHDAIAVLVDVVHAGVRIEAHVTSRVGRFLAVYAPSDALQEAARLPRP